MLAAWREGVDRALERVEGVRPAGHGAPGMCSFNRVNDPPGPAAADVATPEHSDLATRVAQDGMVLLRNDDRTLPLDRARSIAVIGPAGADAVYVSSGSSGVPIAPGRAVTPSGRHRGRRRLQWLLDPDEADMAAVLADFLARLRPAPVVSRARGADGDG